MAARRKPQRKFLSYDHAKRYVNEEAPHVTSRKQYLLWYDDHRPSFLPRWPHHVYKDFTWSDFIPGNVNSFEKTLNRRCKIVKGYREYWAAVKWSQAQSKHYGITTGKQWYKWYDEHEVPEDIPKRPNIVYPHFSWKTWLGKNVDAHIELAKNTPSIVGLHRVIGSEGNIFRIQVWGGGISELRSKCPDQRDIECRPFILWEYESDLMPMVELALQKNGNFRDGNWIIHNVHQLHWDLVGELQVKLVVFPDNL